MVNNISKVEKRIDVKEKPSTREGLKKFNRYIAYLN